jgi:dCMP deaminase
MKEKFKKAFMECAEIFSGLSHARRLRVGAIVVKDDRIISIGYNGMPAGWDNNCEDIEWMGDAGGWLSPDEIEEGWPFEGEYYDSSGYAMKGRYRLKTKSEVLHAERNALDKLARGGEGGLDAALFVTHSPCLECAKSIYGAGIKEVFYKDDYRSNEGVEFLKKSGISVEKIDG